MKDVGEGINMLYIFQRIFDEGSIMQLYGFPIRELRYLLPFVLEGTKAGSGLEENFRLIFSGSHYTEGETRRRRDFHLRRWK